MRYVFILSFCASLIHAQEYAINNIPAEFADEDAVVRRSIQEVDFESQTRMRTRVKQVVTILKPEGQKYLDTTLEYDNYTQVDKLTGTFYDGDGREIKTFKKNKFEDQSAVSRGALYTDDRIKFIPYRPTNYPFTFELNYETTSNTTISEGWFPVSYIPVEYAEYTLNNASGIPLRKKSEAFKESDFSKISESPNRYHYAIANFDRLIREPYAPHLRTIAPHIIFAPEEFNLKTKKGAYRNWQEFGKWMYENLIRENRELEEEEVARVRQMVQGIDDLEERARKVYAYMQSKTRYVNVAIGIGGWEPSKAKDVSETGFGDCKGLSNYLVSLLHAADVPANYTIVYASANDKRLDLDPEFSSLQGNHVIVHVPTPNDTIWLEATSSDAPFNYLGDFTDNRLVLAVNEQGGQIVRTQKFEPKNNKEVSRIQAVLNEQGQLELTVGIESTGLQYDWMRKRFSGDSNESESRVKDQFSYRKNLQVKSLATEVDKEQPKHVLNLQLSEENYGRKMGSSRIIELLPVAKMTAKLKEDPDRIYPVVIDNGYADETFVEFRLPKGYQVDGLPQDVNFQNEFGSYSLRIRDTEGVLQIERKLFRNEGTFPAESYNTFVEFVNRMNENDNVKVIISPI